eukprot:TRINITY_DN4443_c0_g1_i2.p1 TRINITY_DN4443_c0_g1~~TRINITY_DN4443_c0_g1_i2.p1  ORF type:complete len:264 (+),score=62.92 TRINITY_DN4443_c0_g1_i2:121-912(+)
MDTGDSEDTNTRIEQFQEFKELIEKHDIITLIGGGIVSVELASEIHNTYPEKTINIMSSSGLLGKVGFGNFRSKAEAYMRRNSNFNIVYERSKTIPGGKGYLENVHVETETGITFFTDLLLDTSGRLIPNSEALDPQLVNDRGFVRVNNALQVGSYHHIFSGGDVADTPCRKTASDAKSHAVIISENIKLVDKNSENLHGYKESEDTLVVSLGRNSGLSYLSGSEYMGSSDRGSRFSSYLKKMVERLMVSHYWLALKMEKSKL